MTKQGETVIEFTVPLPPPSLRGNSRAHWRRRHADANGYSEKVYLAYAAGHDWGECDAVPCEKCFQAPLREAAVSYTWRYATARPDLDNIARSIKVLQDVICKSPGFGAKDRWYLGLIDDDGNIDPVTFRRERVAHKAEEAVVVRIEKR